jgi:hypothetical protein
MALVATVEPTVKNVRLDYGVPATAATLTITRTGPSGTPATVRAWESAAVVGGSAVVARDFEAPIGVPLTYTAQPYNAAGTALAAATTTITIPSGGCSDTWLTDLARSGNTQLVTLQELAELTYKVPATVHDIITRRAPIVSSDIARTPEFELSFLTATDDDREQAKFTLGNGVPVLLRTPPEDGIGNMYFAVLEYAEQRIVNLATEQTRRWVVQGRQVERPDPALYQPQAPVTYAYVKQTFATYAALKAGRASYDALAYDWAGSSAQDVFPWPPDDV